MDYEKAYKEALKRAKGFKTDEYKDVAEYIFPELSESEDEKIRKEIIDIIDSFEVAQLRTAGLPTKIPKYLAWLEKQGEKKPVEWSEEDEIHQLHAISLIEDIKDWANKDGMHSLCIERCIESIDWLKSLRPQPKDITDKVFEETILKIKTYIAQCNGFNRKHREEVFCLIDSLRPQFSRKPSEEQLEALKNAIHIKPFENPSDSILWGLYEQLKKLREE